MTTNTKADAMTQSNLRKGNAKRIARRTCQHGTTIELADGVKVCTACEMVLK